MAAPQTEGVEPGSLAPQAPPSRIRYKDMRFIIEDLITDYLISQNQPLDAKNRKMISVAIAMFHQNGTGHMWKKWRQR